MISMNAGAASIIKPEQNRTSTDDQFKAAFGDQNLADVLNKVADPNYVDPAKMRQVGKNQMDKDAFLKLMLTQMQNQDPANPLKSHEMAAQMAQFTSLEQLSNINTTLEKMSTTQNAGSPFESLQFIGKMVRGDSSRFTRGPGDKQHEVGINLPQAASKVTVEVKDIDGKVVRTLTLNDLKAGAQVMKWNGVTEEGNEARPGDYSFDIVAEQAQGRKLLVDTQFEGAITGVKFVSGQPVLMVGDKAVKLSDVKQISAPQQMAAVAVNDVTPQQDSAQGRETATKPVSVLDSIPMSQDLRNKLEKETAGVDE